MENCLWRISMYLIPYLTNAWQLPLITNVSYKSITGLFPLLRTLGLQILDVGIPISVALLASPSIRPS